LPTLRSLLPLPAGPEARKRANRAGKAGPMRAAARLLIRSSLFWLLRFAVTAAAFGSLSFAQQPKLKAGWAGWLGVLLKLTE